MAVKKDDEILKGYVSTAGDKNGTTTSGTNGYTTSGSGAAGGTTGYGATLSAADKAKSAASQTVLVDKEQDVDRFKPRVTSDGTDTGGTENSGTDGSEDGPDYWHSDAYYNWLKKQNGSASKAETPTYDTTVPTVFGDTQDPELVKQYQDAMAALEGMKGQTPTYGSQYDAQIQDLYQQIIGRDKFKYDSKTDPLYQQYVQDAVMNGKMAMRDTMGQAAALTGGYGSSYAQAVGQQQYDQYLQRLADVLPQTYGMALDAWKAEGDLLNEKLATTTSLEKSDYNRYLDQLDQYNRNLDRAMSDEQLKYNRMTDAEKQAYSRQLDQYDMQNDYYNRLLGLMQMGYAPSKEDYNAAGLSEAQGAAIKAALTAPTGGGGYYVKKEEPAAPASEPTAPQKYNISDFTSLYAASTTQAEKDEVYKAAAADVKAGLTNFTLDDLKYARGHAG